MKLFVYLFVAMFSITTTSALAKSRELSNDIIITDFSTIEINQGQNNVKPLFKIKNVGNKKYQNIYLKIEPPVAYHNSNRVILEDSGPYKTVSLSPGEEIEFFPGYNFSAKIDQPTTVYSLPYEILFSDKNNKKYITSKQTIQSYARVTNYNSDIIVLDYATKHLHQGQSKVKPIFLLKNVGEKPYKNISVKTHSPTALVNGKPISLQEKGGYQAIDLAPGEETRFFSGFYLSADTAQPKATYSMQYSLSFSDKEGHGFIVPKETIKDYAVVHSYNNDIIVTRYSTTILEQGEGKAHPIFRIKNLGSQPYKDITIKTQSPHITIEDNRIELREEGSHKMVSLKPGEEVEYTLGFGLIANNNQPKGTYSTSYVLTFKDAQGHQFLTPPFEIDRYAMVVGKDENQRLLGGYDSVPLRAKPSEVERQVNATPEKTDQQVLERLKEQIDELEGDVSPSKLMQLKGLIKQIEKGQ